MLSNPSTVSAENDEPQPTGCHCTHRGDSPPADIRRSLYGSGVVHLRGFIEPADLLVVKSELDTLFDNFEQLPRHISPKADGDGSIREIANLIRHVPTLQQSHVYQKCHTLASEIFATPARYGFDHAIYKSPGSDAVKWHQDQFYSKFDRDKQCISFWIPLQAVAATNGGMHYALTPSHSRSAKLLPHTRVTPESHMYHLLPEQISNLNSISPEMQMGDVCLHTPLTPHRSYPNSSGDIRSAWILQFNKYGPLRFVRWENIRKQLSRAVTG